MLNEGLGTSEPATLPIHDAARVRDLAVRALYEELVTFPKPGLVSLIDNGSHTDMDAASFVRSAFSLRHYFRDAAMAGATDASFAILEGLGLDAEQRMLRATGGVNTHRGAIFHLGLLAAASGRRLAGLSSVADLTLGDAVKRTWGAAVAVHRRDPDSHGSRAGGSQRISGALAEAVAGYPSVFEVALPAYRAALVAGASANQARVQTFFTLLAKVDDTNLLHRGGPSALMHARAVANEFLHRGGVFESQWRERAMGVHVDFCARRLSPGGSADLLAACIFAHALDA